jgi:hypothetical protein
VVKLIPNNKFRLLVKKYSDGPKDKPYQLPDGRHFLKPVYRLEPGQMTPLMEHKKKGFFIFKRLTLKEERFYYPEIGGDDEDEDLDEDIRDNGIDEDQPQPKGRFTGKSRGGRTRTRVTIDDVRVLPDPAHRARDRTPHARVRTRTSTRSRTPRLPSTRR